jgi:hypothetical protein
MSPIDAISPIVADCCRTRDRQGGRGHDRDKYRRPIPHAGIAIQIAGRGIPHSGGFDSNMMGIERTIAWLQIFERLAFVYETFMNLPPASSVGGNFNLSYLAARKAGNGSTPARLS